MQNIRFEISLFLIILNIIFANAQDSSIQDSNIQNSNIKAMQNFADSINLQAAYDQGFTGKNILVGVVDHATRAEHQAFGGRVETYGNAEIIDWNNVTHGTEVSSVIAGYQMNIDPSKLPDNLSNGHYTLDPNNPNMQGVAFNANIYAGEFITESGSSNANRFSWIEYLTNKPEMKIINNSWGGMVSSEIEDFYINHREDFDSRVFVWAAGNDGRKDANLNATNMQQEYGLGEAANAITVSAFDYRKLQRDKDTGKITLNDGVVAYFSNLAYGSELWSVMAPGMNIFMASSAGKGYDNNHDSRYILANGTSFATPIVSGVLALVQEKYPWLNGKQLADTILTTANNDFEAPKQITLKENIEKPTDATTTIDKTYTIGAWCDLQTHATCTTLAKEQVFGRGILDAGKAINGIALLDSNRMTAKDVIIISELGNSKEALETFNTKGYDGEFSNDISSSTWQDKYHKVTTFGSDVNPSVEANKNALKDITNIGLRKIGEGTLTLSGNNTYSGATLIEGGTLDIKGSVAGSGVVVRSGGTLIGGGKILTQVIMNGGVIKSENSSQNITIGQISGDSGILQVNISNGGKIIVDKNINQASPIIKTASLDSSTSNATTTTTPLGNSDISKLTLVLDFDIDRFMQNGEKIESGVFLENKNDSIKKDSQFGNVAMSDNVSATLTTTPLINYDDPDNLKLTIETIRNKDAYSKHTSNKELGDVLYAIAQSGTINNDSKMQNIIAMLDSQTNPYAVKATLKQIEDNAKIFDAGLENSINLQSSLNSKVLWQLLSKNPHNRGYDTWVTPFVQYNSFDMSDSKYKGYSYGALLGFDALWGENMLGIHTAFATNDAKAFMTNASSLGYYLGLHGKLKISALYFMIQARFGYENVEYEQMFIDSATINSANNMIINTALGMGAEFGFGGFDIGPLIWGEYNQINRGKLNLKNTSEFATLTPLKENESFGSLNLTAGAKLGYTWNSNINLSLLGGYKIRVYQGARSGEMSFLGYDENKFSTNYINQNKNVATIAADLKAEFESGFFSSINLSGDFGKGYTGFGGNLQIGYKFGGSQPTRLGYINDRNEIARGDSMMTSSSLRF